LSGLGIPGFLGRRFGAAALREKTGVRGLKCSNLLGRPADGCVYGQALRGAWKELWVDAELCLVPASAGASGGRAVELAEKCCS
jgi:hypothetical protein